MSRSQPGAGHIEFVTVPIEGEECKLLYEISHI